MPADHLRQQLAELQFPLDDATRDALRQSVCAYVDSLKAEGQKPEHVLVGLKRIAAEAGVRSSALSRQESRESRADLLMDIVSWSIEHYYLNDKRS